MKSALIWNYAGCFIIGYVFGCINLAYIIARHKGFDIRAQGTKNAGTSNALVTMGVKYGILVLFADMLKTTLSIILARSLFPDLPHLAAATGVACIIGHIFPFWLRFSGGKGFASALGMALAMDWRLFLGLIVLTLLVSALTDYLVLATASVCISLPAYVFAAMHDNISALIIALASIVILAKHWKNYLRVYQGTEPKVRAILGKLL
jgi:glycerol-3-phosphate acyltransferase PlsY